jgi:hypothetical protein
MMYARAWIAGRDRPQFSIKSIEGLSRLAALNQRYELAKWAAEEALKIRRAEGTKPQPFMNQIMNSPWFEQTDALPNPEPILQELAGRADLELRYGAPQHHIASFLGAFILQKGGQAAKLAIRRTDRAEEIHARIESGVDASHFRRGDPIEVVIREGVGDSRCTEISLRDSGYPFDCLDSVEGVISTHDEAKGRANVSTDLTRYCVLSYRTFPAVRDWEVGTIVKMLGAWFSDHFTPYDVSCSNTDPNQTEGYRRHEIAQKSTTSPCS